MSKNPNLPGEAKTVSTGVEPNEVPPEVQRSSAPLTPAVTEGPNVGKAGEYLRGRYPVGTGKQFIREDR